MAIIGPSRPSRLCHACGTTIDAEAEICPYCGVRQAGVNVSARTPGALTEISPRKIGPALLMMLPGFTLVFGVHRFYVGKKATGALMFFTLGGLGLWALIDFFMLMMGKFKDKEGRTLTEW